MKAALALLGLVVGVVFFYFGEMFSQHGSVDFHGALPGEAAESLPTAGLVIDGIALVSGIVIGNFYGRLKILKSKGIKVISISRELREMTQSVDFYIGLCAAPVVFGVVIGLAGGTPLFASTVLAFQNGFFWQTVMPTKPQGA